MISVEEALGEYTDKIINKQDCSLETYRTKMDKKEYKEFVELAGFISLINDSNEQKKNMESFQKLNDYKMQLYDNVNETSNFRTEDGDASHEAQDNLDKIFEEEFKDE